MTAVGGRSYHVQDGQQDEVNVDCGDTVPVVDRSNTAVVRPEESPGQLVQRRPLWLLRDTLRRACCETEINPIIQQRAPTFCRILLLLQKLWKMYNNYKIVWMHY